MTSSNVRKALCLKSLSKSCIYWFSNHAVLSIFFFFNQPTWQESIFLMFTVVELSRVDFRGMPSLLITMTPMWDCTRLHLEKNLSEWKSELAMIQNPTCNVPTGLDPLKDIVHVHIDVDIATGVGRHRFGSVVHDSSVWCWSCYWTEVSLSLQEIPKTNTTSQLPHCSATSTQTRSEKSK